LKNAVSSEPRALAYPFSQAISLDTIIAMSKWSRRTWWRRISSAEVRRLPDDPRGRVMLAWDSVRHHVPLPLSRQDLQTMLQADAGDMAAQNEFGQHLFVLNHPAAAIYWIDQAARQGCADAMQWLGVAHATGQGVERNEYLALMWIAKAASQGHVIARAQADGLLGPAALARAPPGTIAGCDFSRT
jgi:TPR repeat protein